LLSTSSRPRSAAFAHETRGEVSVIAPVPPPRMAPDPLRRSRRPTDISAPSLSSLLVTRELLHRKVIEQIPGVDHVSQPAHGPKIAAEARDIFYRVSWTARPVSSAVNHVGFPALRCTPPCSSSRTHRHGAPLGAIGPSDGHQNRSGISLVVRTIGGCSLTVSVKRRHCGNRRAGSGATTLGRFRSPPPLNPRPNQHDSLPGHERSFCVARVRSDAPRRCQRQPAASTTVRGAESVSGPDVTRFSTGGAA